MLNFGEVLRDWKGCLKNCLSHPLHTVHVTTVLHFITCYFPCSNPCSTHDIHSVLHSDYFTACSCFLNGSKIICFAGLGMWISCHCYGNDFQVSNKSQHFPADFTIWAISSVRPYRKKYILEMNVGQYRTVLWQNVLQAAKHTSTCLLSHANYRDTNPCLMARLIRMLTVLKCSPDLTPAPDSREDPLSVSYQLLGHPLGQHCPNSWAPGIPLQEEHFHTAINRWKKAGRRGKTHLQITSSCFELCYTPSQFSTASLSYSESLAFFFFSWFSIWLFFSTAKLKQHAQHTYPQASSVYFIPLWATKNSFLQNIDGFLYF